MTQDELIILLLKVILIFNIAAIASFIAQYTALAPWWRNSIGRTLVVKDILLSLALVPSLLSLFLSFNRLTSHIAAWVDVVLLGAIGPVMVWRMAVFRSVHREKRGRQEAPDEPGPSEGDP